MRERRVRRRVVVAEAGHARGVDQHDPEQADAETGRPDHDVLPARLQRLVRTLAGDEQRADHGRQLDRDPQHAEVGDDRRDQQRQAEQVEQRPVAPPQADVADSRSQVAHRVDRHDRVHERDREQEHAAQAVEEERAAERVAPRAAWYPNTATSAAPNAPTAAAAIASRSLAVTEGERRHHRDSASASIARSQTAISRAAPPCPRCWWSWPAPRSAVRTRRRTGPPGAGRAAAGSRSRTAARARSPPSR